jgi:hypothetical protein
MDRPDKAKYRYIEFMPAPGKVADLSMPVGEGFNLYIGTTFTPAPGRCDLILNHIQQVWCRGNEVAYDYVIQWLARMVQYPQERGETVIVLRSGQGAGKNIIADIFQEYFGVHTCMLTNTEHLAGFNDHLSYAVFVFLNEAIWGGNKKLEGTIKSIITDKSLRTEKKFYSQVETRNCTHIMVATNEDWSVPVGHDDRRFFMLDLDNSKIGDATYFGALADQVNHGGDRAFVHHLMHVDLSAFDVRKMPNLESQVKLDHKIRSADRITQWWLDVLTEGAFIVKHKDGVSGPQRIDWPDDQELCINTNHLYEAFESRARGAHIEGHTTVARKLADLLGIDGGGHGEYAGLRVKRARTNDPINSRPRQYVLPSLKDARAAAERYLKQSGPWAYEVDGDQQAEDGPSHPVRPAPPTPPVRPRCAGNQ